jgi:hypothetical protein
MYVRLYCHFFFFRVVFIFSSVLAVLNWCCCCAFCQGQISHYYGDWRALHAGNRATDTRTRGQGSELNVGAGYGHQQGPLPLPILVFPVRSHLSSVHKLLCFDSNLVWNFFECWAIIWEGNALHISNWAIVCLIRKMFRESSKLDN